jgi:hypothetical protein
MMTQQIPGVPEGWALVRIGRINAGEWTLDDFGDPYMWKDESSTSVFPVVRKIEKPAAYRPFANAEEFKPYWGKPVRLKDGVGFDSVTSTSECTVYVNSGPARVQYTMSEAFEQLAFADGTPFGVKIDE